MSDNYSSPLVNLVSTVNLETSCPDRTAAWEHAIDEATFGGDHPDVAESLNNMAELYYRTKRYREARPLFERALAIRERVLGEDHPRTATTRDWLALPGL